MNGKVGMGLGIVAGAVVVGGLLYLALAPVEDAEVRAEARAQRQKSGQVSADRKSKKSRFVDEAEVSYKKTDASARTKPRMQAPKDWFADLPAKDRAIAKRIQDAQDADNREAILKAAEDALSSQNADVRKAAVDALSMQGEAAIQPLLKFIVDKDKDVADSAYHAWDDAVDNNVDGDLDKLGAIQTVLAVAKDKEHVKSAVGKIEMFDQSRAIRELAKLAKEGGKASEAARESYENVTGEPFESWAAAELKAMAIDRDNKAAEGGSDDASDTP